MAQPPSAGGEGPGRVRRGDERRRLPSGDIAATGPAGAGGPARGGGDHGKGKAAAELLDWRIRRIAFAFGNSHAHVMCEAGRPSQEEEEVLLQLQLSLSLSFLWGLHCMPMCMCIYKIEYFHDDDDEQQVIWFAWLAMPSIVLLF